MYVTGQNDFGRLHETDQRPPLAPSELMYQRNTTIDPLTQDFRLMVQGQRAAASNVITASAALEARKKYVKAQARNMRNAMIGNTHALPEVVGVQGGNYTQHRRVPLGSMYDRVQPARGEVGDPALQRGAGGDPLSSGKERRLVLSNTYPGNDGVDGVLGDVVGDMHDSRQPNRRYGEARPNLELYNNPDDERAGGQARRKQVKAAPLALHILTDTSIGATYDPTAVATALANATYNIPLSHGNCNTNSSSTIATTGSDAAEFQLAASGGLCRSSALALAERERIRRFRAESLDLSNKSERAQRIAKRRLQKDQNLQATSNDDVTGATSTSANGNTGNLRAEVKRSMSHDSMRSSASHASLGSGSTVDGVDKKVVPQSPIRRPMLKLTDSNNGTRGPDSKITNRQVRSGMGGGGSSGGGGGSNATLPFLDEFEKTDKDSKSGTNGMARLPRLSRNSRDSLPDPGKVPKEEVVQSNPNTSAIPRPIDNTKYRYKFYSGNNGRVILQAFRKRTWMHPVSSNKDPEKSHKEIDSRPGSSNVENSKGDTPEEQFEILWEMYRSPKRYKTSRYNNVVLNHIQNNNCLVTKKGLFFTLRDYCKSAGIEVHSVIPRTYFIPPVSTDGAANASNDDTEEFLAYNDRAMKRLAAREEAKKAAAAAGDTVAEDICIDADPEVMHSLSSGNSDGLIWICKPASLTNRGYGITVLRGVEEVLHLTKRPLSVLLPAVTEGSESAMVAGGTDLDAVDPSLLPNPLDACREQGVKPGMTALTKAASRRGAQEGWIVQEYIERPLLVAGRKFDIRVFVLLHLDKSRPPKAKKGEPPVEHKQGLQAYFYAEPYVRTSWKPYSLDDISDRECHLTNDAIQKKAKGYGKFENGNKLTLEQWQETICRDYPDAPQDVVAKSIWPEIKRLTALSVSAALPRLEKTIINKSFELLGYDYMVTDDYKPLLIEINSNPCLEFSCPLLSRLILELVNAVFRTSVDRLCTAPAAGARTKACEAACTYVAAETNKFEELDLIR